MKKNIFISLIFLINYLNSYTQSWQSTTIQTPTGVNISAQKWIGSLYNSSDIAYWNFYWTNGHNVEIIEDASPFYNCHGYAWHNIEGKMAQSDLVNIDDRNPNNGSELHVIEKYYSSSSPAYKQVSSNSKANLKVSYYPSDHSAVTTSNPNYFISKLAYGPLVKHTPWDIPFVANGTIKYYDLNDVQINVSYNNTTLLCDGDNRYLNCLNFSDADFIYNWNTSSVIDKISGIGTRYLTIDGSSGNGGEGTVSLTVTSPSGLTATSNIVTFPWVGKPKINSQIPLAYYPSGGYNNICNLQTYTTNMIVNGATNVTWERIAASPSTTTWYQSGNNISFYFWAVNQTAVFRITASNSCGTTSYDFGFKSIQCGTDPCEMDYLISPNPSSSGLITIVPNIPPPCDTYLSEPSIQEVSIYDSNENLKKIKKYREKTTTAEISTSDLVPGVYIVVIDEGTKKVRKRIIVK